MSDTTIQCEGFRRYGGAFTLGPVRWEQCTEPAAVMLKIEQQGDIKDLPACLTCWKECLQHADQLIVHEAKPIT